MHTRTLCVAIQLHFGRKSYYHKPGPENATKTPSRMLQFSQVDGNAQKSKYCSLQITGGHGTGF